MKKIKKILACVDLSEYSTMTLEYACEIAKGTDAEILVLNVINEKDVYAVEMAARIYPVNEDLKTYVKQMTVIRNEDLRSLIKERFFEEKSRMTLKIEVGIPYETIIETAENENADLVVMANKGRGNLSKVLFGSAAEKVFRHCKVPVLSVRSKDKFTRNG